MAPKTEWTQANLLTNEALRKEHRHALSVKNVNRRPEMRVLCAAPWRTTAVDSKRSLLEWVNDPTARNNDGSAPIPSPSSVPKDSSPRPDLPNDVVKYLPGYSLPEPTEWTVSARTLYTVYYSYAKATTASGNRTDQYKA